MNLLGTLKSGVPVYDRPRSHLHAGAAALLPEALAAINDEGREFFVATHDFGRVIGQSSCVATGENDEVVFARRVNRFGFTRFVKNRAQEESTTLVVVLKKIEKGYLLITAFVGRQAPPEPWDPNADEASGPFWATHALVWDSEPVVEGTEIPETPAPAKPQADCFAHLDEVLEKARAWGEARHPGAPAQHHAAFANSVGEAVTAVCGGWGGPSIRQYTAVGELSRMGRFPGRTIFEEACVILEEVCYGPIRENHVSACVGMGAYPGHPEEGDPGTTFDDAPGDIEGFWRVVKALPPEKKWLVRW